MGCEFFGGSGCELDDTDGLRAVRELDSSCNPDPDGSGPLFEFDPDTNEL